MAKLTRNSYKRKVILFGVILFVSIALISTGFAAWIMSTNAKGEKDGNVTVGQVTDSQLKIENLEIDKNVFAFEPLDTDTTGRVRYDGTNKESLTIRVTGTVRPTEFLGELKIALVIPEGVKKAADLGYIVLPTCATISETTGGYKVTDVDKETGTYAIQYDITFTWGDKFGGQNPGVYYDTDAEGLNVSDADVKKELENLRAVIYGYDTELNAAVDEAARAVVIEKHKNDSLAFKVIVTAKAN